MTVIASELFSAEIPGRVLAGELDVGVALHPEPMRGVRSEPLRMEPHVTADEPSPPTREYGPNLAAQPRERNPARCSRASSPRPTTTASSPPSRSPASSPASCPSPTRLPKRCSPASKQHAKLDCPGLTRLLRRRSRVRTHRAQHRQARRSWGSGRSCRPLAARPLRSSAFSKARDDAQTKTTGCACQTIRPARQPKPQVPPGSEQRCPHGVGPGRPGPRVWWP